MVLYSMVLCDILKWYATAWHGIVRYIMVAWCCKARWHVTMVCCCMAWSSVGSSYEFAGQILCIRVEILTRERAQISRPLW